MKKNEKLKEDRVKKIIGYEDTRRYYERCEEKAAPLQ
jgi:hypothetical protein